jgi:hypothetical protein
VDYPEQVSGLARKLYFRDDQQTPDTMNIVYNFPDKVLLFEMRIWNPYGLEGDDNAIAVYGSEGYLTFGRGSFKAFDAAGKLILRDDRKEPTTHARNFIDCVKSRKAPNAEIEIGHMSSTLAHLGNIVARTGRTLRFDAKTETILGDAEANRLLAREYRKHWATPQGV